MKGIIKLITEHKLNGTEDKAKAKLLTDFTNYISDSIKVNKLTKQFLNAFIEMYDTEDLHKIDTLIRREINERNKSVINNG